MKLRRLLPLLAVGYIAIKHENSVRVAIRLDGKGIMPVQSTPGAAGYDIKSPIDTVIPAGEVVKIPTGLHVWVPFGRYLSLQTRSGLSIKRGIILANGTEGVVDSDYHDEIILALWNRSSEDFQISRGDKIAQFLIKDYYSVVFDKARWIDVLRDAVYRKLALDNKGRVGGLGSTGIR